MRRRKVSGVGDGVPEELRYKTVAEGSMLDKTFDEYTDEELLAMADEIEKESKCFASIDFSKYRSVSY